MGEINVVPYIDVMLVLLVIFMITAPLLTQGVKVDLVQAVAEPMQSEEPEPFVVTVNRDGQYFINDHDKPATLEQITASARSVLGHRSKTDFMVRGDKAVPYEYVVKAMTALKAADVKSVGLVTEPSEK
jgi:biopolymer transport protein TolR